MVMNVMMAGVPLKFEAREYILVHYILQHWKTRSGHNSCRIRKEEKKETPLAFSSKFGKEDFQQKLINYFFQHCILQS